MLTKFQMPFDSLNAGFYPTEIFSDTATKEKIRQHLYNFNDIISEEDLINIKTEMTPAAGLQNNFTQGMDHAQNIY